MLSGLALKTKETSFLIPRNMKYLIGLPNFWLNDAVQVWGTRIHCKALNSQL